MMIIKLIDRNWLHYHIYL